MSGNPRCCGLSGLGKSLVELGVNLLRWTWKLGDDDEFRRRHAAAHDWAFAHLADREQGEWYGWARRDGTPTHQAKGSLWKGPFHLPRMHLVCWQVLERRLARQGG